MLKARLSEFLDAVREGEDILVTDRGRPIARITAVRDQHHREGRRDQLIRAGRLRPPRRRIPKDFYSRALPADPKGRALAALLEERREGRWGSGTRRRSFRFVSHKPKRRSRGSGIAKIRTSRSGRARGLSRPLVTVITE